MILLLLSLLLLHHFPHYTFATSHSLPQLESTDNQLSSVSFVLSHNAGTGYKKLGSITSYTSFFTNAWLKCQKGSFYDQLHFGARALDLRITLDDNSELRFKHGDYTVTEVTFDSAINDALEWHALNPDEIVMLIPSHLDEDVAELVAQSLYALNIPVVECDSLRGVSVSSAISTAGSTLFAFFGDDCTDSNYNSNDLVYCRDETDIGDDDTGYFTPYQSCTKKEWTQPPFTSLFDYTLENAVEGSNNNNNLFQIQGIWQISHDQVEMGVKSGSTLLKDNTKSDVNLFHADNVFNNLYDTYDLNLFSIDNVGHGGLELATNLRHRSNGNVNHKNAVDSYRR